MREREGRIIRSMPESPASPHSFSSPGMDTITVGRLRDDEIEPLQCLAESVWHVAYRDLISQEQIAYMLDQRYRPALLRQLLARGDRIWAARGGDQLVGFTHAFRISDDECKLDKLYVDSSLQRHGIGQLLVREVEHYARHKACRHLVLRVHKRNAPAISAYLKYGFRVSSSVTEDIGQGFVMDDYVMRKRLEGNR